MESIVTSIIYNILVVFCQTINFTVILQAKSEVHKTANTKDSNKKLAEKHKESAGKFKTSAKNVKAEKHEEKVEKVSLTDRC